MDMFRSRDLIRLSGSGSVGSLFTKQVDHVVPDTAAISVQTYYVAAALVRHGAGVAVVDEFTARASMGEDLDFRPLEESVRFNVYCIHLEDRPLSRLASELVATMKQSLVEERA